MIIKNFSVQMHLVTPIILQPHAYLTLDALLAARIYADTQSVERAHTDIPLAQENGVWCGSAVFLSDKNRPVDAPFKAGLSLREAVDPLYRVMGNGRNANTEKKNPCIDTVRGPYANTINLEYEAYEVTDVTWYGRGDMEAVARLLSDVRFIGKKHHQGYGQVAPRNGIILDEMDENYALRMPVQTRSYPMRPIPVTVWEAMGEARHPYHFDAIVSSQPPYFDTTHAVRCMVPHTRICFWI